MDNIPNEPGSFSKSDLKKIRYFILFGLIIILSQVFQFVNMRNIDDKYTKIIASGNTFTSSLNSILFESSILHRSLLTLTMSSDQEAEIATMNKRVQESWSKIRTEMSFLEDFFSETANIYTPDFEELKKTSKEYDQTYHRFLQVLASKNRDSIDYHRVKVLRPAFENYQHMQTTLLKKVTEGAIAESAHISEKATKNGWILLIAGNAVLFLVLIFLIVLIIRPDPN